MHGAPYMQQWQEDQLQIVEEAPMATDVPPAFDIDDHLSNAQEWPQVRRKADLRLLAFTALGFFVGSIVTWVFPI